MLNSITPMRAGGWGAQGTWKRKVREGWPVLNWNHRQNFLTIETLTIEGLNNDFNQI
jgi:hypothetical protein